MAFIRIKGSISPSTYLYIEKTIGVIIEDYGQNVGSTSFFVLSPLFTALTIPFVVDDTTVDYYVWLIRATGNIDIDCVVTIPLTNGKDGLVDLFEQGLTINNIKNIGVL